MIPFLLALCLCIIQFIFRSSDLASDGPYRLALISKINPIDAQFGGWMHFLQMPLSYYTYVWADKMGLALTHRTCLVSYGLLGNFMTLYFLFKSVVLEFKSKWVATVVVVIASLSPMVWFYWNGELGNLAMGFSALAFYLALQKRSLWTISLCLALAALCRIDFALIAPGLVWFRGNYQINKKDLFEYFKKLTFLTLYTTAFFILILLVGLWAMGIISLSFRSIILYYQNSFDLIKDYVPGYRFIHFIKATKGFFLTLFPAMNSFTEIVRGAKTPWSNSIRIVYLTYALYCIALIFTLVFLLRKICRGNSGYIYHFIGAILMILPLEFIFNLRFFYQTEEYHAAAIGAFCWLVALVLIPISNSQKARRIFYACLTIYAAGFFTLYVYPAVQYPKDLKISHDFFLAHPGTLVICDNEVDALSSENLKQFPILREKWDDLSRQMILDKIQEKITESLKGGSKVYLAGLKCNLSYLYRNGGHNAAYARTLDSLDFNELRSKFKIEKLEAPRVPLAWYTQYDPASWHYEEAYEIKGY